MNWKEIKEKHSLSLIKTGSTIVITMDAKTTMEFDVKAGVELSDLTGDKGFCKFVNDFFGDPLRGVVKNLDS